MKSDFGVVKKVIRESVMNIDQSHSRRMGKSRGDKVKRVFNQKFWKKKGHVAIGLKCGCSICPQGRQLVCLTSTWDKHGKVSSSCLGKHSFCFSPIVEVLRPKGTIQAGHTTILQG